MTWKDEGLWTRFCKDNPEDKNQFWLLNYQSSSGQKIEFYKLNQCLLALVTLISEGDMGKENH